MRNREERAIQDVSKDYALSTFNNDFIAATKALAFVPELISTLINAVGNLKVYNRLFVPKIGRDLTNRNGGTGEVV
jgi:hypothetical protein